MKRTNRSRRHPRAEPRRRALGRHGEHRERGEDPYHVVLPTTRRRRLPISARSRSSCLGGRCGEPSFDFGDRQVGTTSPVQRFALGVCCANAAATTPSTPASPSPATTPRPITAHRRCRPATPDSSRAASSRSPSPRRAPGPGGHPEHRTGRPDGGAHRQRGHHPDSAGPAPAVLRWTSPSRRRPRKELLKKKAHALRHHQLRLHGRGQRRRQEDRGPDRDGEPPRDQDQGQAQAPRGGSRSRRGSPRSGSRSRRPMSSAKRPTRSSRSSSADGTPCWGSPTASADRVGARSTAGADRVRPNGHRGDRGRVLRRSESRLSKVSAPFGSPGRNDRRVPQHRCHSEAAWLSE